MAKKRLTVGDEPHLIVRTLEAVSGPAHPIGRHAHPWGQLIHAARGVMVVATDAGTWVAPPHWAVWAPAGAPHALRFATASRLATLYIRPDLMAGRLDETTVVTVTPLLRELIARAIALSALDARVGQERSIADLIVGEMAASSAPAVDLPRPASAPLRAAAASIEADPAAALANGHLARAAGLGQRTLERRFLAETGLTLGRWARQARLIVALERLAGGASVKQVAPAAGYASPSAFVAAFRAAFGETPGRYFGTRDLKVRAPVE